MFVKEFCVEGLTNEKRGPVPSKSSSSQRRGREKEEEKILNFLRIPKHL